MTRGKLRTVCAAAMPGQISTNVTAVRNARVLSLTILIISEKFAEEQPPTLKFYYVLSKANLQRM